MGEENPNLELVKSIYAQWARGDFSDRTWADPEIEFVLDDGLSRQPARGVEEMGRIWREYLTVWDDWQVEVHEIRELAPDRFLVLLTNRGRGRASGIGVDEMTRESANGLWLRDGKVVKLVTAVRPEPVLQELDLATEGE